MFFCDDEKCPQRKVAPHKHKDAHGNEVDPRPPVQEPAPAEQPPETP